MTRKPFGTLTLLWFALLLPTTAHAHLGGLEVVAPVASAVLGFVFGSVAFLLPSRRRFLIPLGASAILIGVTFSFALAQVPSEPLGVLFGGALALSALALAPFLGMFCLTLVAVPAMRKYLATWRRVKAIVRSDR